MKELSDDAYLAIRVQGSFMDDGVCDVGHEGLILARIRSGEALLEITDVVVIDLRRAGEWINTMVRKGDDLPGSRCSSREQTC